MFSAREKVLNTFKSVKNFDKLPTHKPTPEPATEPSTEPTKHKRSKLKLQQEFITEIFANKKDVNNEIFWNYISIRLHLF